MKVALKINGKNLIFEIDGPTYEKSINEMTPNNRTAPMKNFLMRTVTQECKEDLKLFLKHPAAAQLIYPQVMEQYIPDLEITVGELKGAPGK